MYWDDGRVEAADVGDDISIIVRHSEDETHHFVRIDQIDGDGVQVFAQREIEETEK
jgi:predicted double-glycine peptidase